MKTKITGKLLLRNAIVILMVCGALWFYALPVPSIVLRGAFVVLCGLCVFKRGLSQQLSSLEISILIFLGINILYFLGASSGLDTPSASAMGSIMMALISMSAFAFLSSQRLCEERFIVAIFVVLLVASIGYFYYMRDSMLIESALDEDQGITNNGSVAFVALLPWLFLIKKRWVSMLGLFVCLFFLVLGAKRGNMLAAIIPSILFVAFVLRALKGWWLKLLCVIGVIAVVGGGVVTFLEEDEYLQQRLEDTMEGNSSGRDTIYRNALDCWWYSDDAQFWFGHGFLGTIPQIGKMAHNDWLEILVDYGVFGVILYGMIFYRLGKAIWNEKNRTNRQVLMSCMAIWLLKSLYSMAYLETLWVILLAPVGIVVGRRNNVVNKIDE